MGLNYRILENDGKFKIQHTVITLGYYDAIVTWKDCCYYEPALRSENKYFVYMFNNIDEANEKIIEFKEFERIAESGESKEWNIVK